MARSQRFSCLSLVFTLVLISTAACMEAPASLPASLTPSVSPSASETALPPSQTPSPTITLTLTPTITPTPTPIRLVPKLDHIVMILFENEEYTETIGNPQMPNFNRLAKSYTLLSQYYAITHPSLPNYLALISGEYFGINTDYPSKIIDATNLPDLLESHGLTWKTYQESMPGPCGLQDTLRYNQKHNPFVFFSDIRNNPSRCNQTVVPLTQLQDDIQNNALPNYAFIMPNLCDSAHDCDVKIADTWLGNMVNTLTAYQPLLEDGLIVITWDEGIGVHTCCGLTTGGGRVATILISSKVKQGFNDNTPYTHYSMLKTILYNWDLTELGHTADPQTTLISAPWQEQTP